MRIEESLVLELSQPPLSMLRDGLRIFGLGIIGCYENSQREIVRGGLQLERAAVAKSRSAQKRMISRCAHGVEGKLSATPRGQLKNQGSQI